MQRELSAVFVALLPIVAGCTSPRSSTDLPIADLPTVAPTNTIARPTPASSTTDRQTEAANLPALGVPEPPTPFVATSFADFPGNLADGEPASNFSARLLGGGHFSLAERGENYLLVFPTVVGCGDCIFGINQIKFANEAFQDSGLTVLILDLYVDDDPETWQYFADTVDQPNFLWAVVEHGSFAADYNIRSLGTMFLVSPDGKMVFRSDYPLPAYHLEELFALTAQ